MVKNNHRAPRRRQTEEQRQRTLQALRIGDLNKVFGLRYGNGKLFVFADDDAGRADLRLLVDHYAFSNPLAMPRVIRTRAPWLSDAERDELLDEVNRFPRRWTAQALGNELNLTEFR